MIFRFVSKLYTYILAPKQPRYIRVKWFATGTPWERSPEDFGPALVTIEQAKRLEPQNLRTLEVQLIPTY